MFTKEEIEMLKEIIEFAYDNGFQDNLEDENEYEICISIEDKLGFELKKF